MQKALHGTLQRIDVRFALEVERATNGAVPVASWVEPARGALRKPVRVARAAVGR